MGKIRDYAVMFSPSVVLLFVLMNALGEGGMPNLLVVGSLVALQIAFIGVESLLWGKRVAESAAGMNDGN